jgi:cytochrome c oxidase subunit I+III
VAFYPMHHLGLAGMPRRVYTYPAEMGWGTLNLVATLGALTIAVSVLVFLVNVFRSLRHGEAAGPNPWGAGTLEWATSSPPPPCNFHAIPVVHGRDALWEPPTRPDEPVAVSGLATHTREVLVTTVATASPDHRYDFPEPTIWPFVCAVTTSIFFIGSIFTPWAVVWGSALVAVPMILWFWPKRKETEEHLDIEARPIKAN